MTLGAGLLVLAVGGLVRPLAARGSQPGDAGRCRKDTFGMAGEHFSRPFERGLEDLKCEFRYRDAAEQELMTLNYYPSIEDFTSFNGTDLVPERAWEYDSLYGRVHRKTLKPWAPGRYPKGQTRAKIAECEIPQDDGGAYHVQRVGPIVSTGNYDYWQFGWKDVAGLSEALKKHPEGIYVTSTFSGAVLESGKVLGHPPIHIHHIHVTPGPSVRYKRGPMIGDLVMEQHGDYQCTEADGGLSCLFERAGDGYGKLVQAHLDLEGELNDVRAPNSEPLVWWYQVVLRWHPRTMPLKPLSQLFLVGPGGPHSEVDQKTHVLTFKVPTDTHSFYWYQGAMPRDGALVRNKLHAHNTMFMMSMFVAATPEALGLGDPKLQWPERASKPLADLGFESPDALERYLLSNLEASGEWHDRHCPAGEGCSVHHTYNRWNREMSASGTVPQQRPAIVCESWVSNEDFQDPRSKKVFAYDRRAPACCKPWSFRRGQVYTVIALMAPMKTPPGPWRPNSVPPTGLMHIHWFMGYDAADRQSHYSNLLHTQKLTELIHNHPGSQADTLIKYTAILYQVMLFFEKHPAAWAAVALLLGSAAWCVWRCCWRCWRCGRAKRVADLPIVRAAKQVPCCPKFTELTAIKAARYAHVLAEHDE